MTVEVASYDDPKTALHLARHFLAGDPLLNNLVATLLATRVVEPQPGRYWIAVDDDKVAGMALQSPLDRGVVLTRMEPRVAMAIAEALSAEDRELPGVLGESAIAARFAGAWTELRKTAAYPAAGQRIYEARAVLEGRTAPGAMQRARTPHQSLVCNWMTAFQSEIGEPAAADTESVARRISAGEIFLWDHRGIRSMAAVTAPALATSRVQYVYTPQEYRGRGYAEALVRGLTRQILAEGYRPILFADLANPTSNSIYRRIGYAAMVEVTRYRF